MKYAKNQMVKVVQLIQPSFCVQVGDVGRIYLVDDKDDDYTYLVEFDKIGEGNKNEKHYEWFRDDELTLVLRGANMIECYDDPGTGYHEERLQERLHITCPYCGFENETNHSDGWWHVPDLYHEFECENCDKSFVFKVRVKETIYDVQKAPCLNEDNGTEHCWVPIINEPIQHSYMKCLHCFQQRECTVSTCVYFYILTTFLGQVGL